MYLVWPWPKTDPWSHSVTMLVTVLQEIKVSCLVLQNCIQKHCEEPPCLSTASLSWTLKRVATCQPASFHHLSYLSYLTLGGLNYLASSPAFLGFVTRLPR